MILFLVDGLECKFILYFLIFIILFVFIMLGKLFDFCGLVLIVIELLL